MFEFAFAAGVAGDDVSVAAQQVLIGGEAVEPDGAAGVGLASGDAEFGAESVSEAVGEARGGVVIDTGGIDTGEEFGGGGLTVTEASVILEEINRAGANSGACHAQMYTMGTVLRHGSAEQKQKYLPGIAKGELPFAKPERPQGIWNLHPRKGESLVYLATGTTTVSEDFGLVSLMAGFGDTHPILLLAGTTTLGTQGAVEFVCREGSVNALLSRFSGGKLAPFSALIRVKVSGGVPVSSDLVTVHLMNSREPR